MRKTLEVFIQAIAVKRFDRLDDAPVQLAATLAKHACMGDLVCEGVLEGVLDIREETALVQELGVLQRSEGLTKVIIAQTGDRLQDRVWNIAANRGGGLQKRLVARQQAVDTRGQQSMNGRRDGQALERSLEPVVAPAADQEACLDQGADALLEKQRVAVRRQKLLERREACIVAEKVVQKFLGRFQRQRLEAHLRVEAPAAPRVLIL